MQQTHSKKVEENVNYNDSCLYGMVAPSGDLSERGSLCGDMNHGGVDGWPLVNDLSYSILSKE